MSKRRDLLACFRSMPPETIKRLSSAQKHDLLAAFHAHLNDPHEDKHHKLKMNAKYRSTTSYKGYVRRNMPAIIRKLIARTRQQLHQLKPKFKPGSAGERRRTERLETHLREMALEGGREEMNCSICLETLVRPVLTVCGHAFCYQCLDESLLFSSNCPNCRESIKGIDLVPCALLDAFIRTTAAPPRSPALTAYNDRVRRFKEWRGRREIDLRSLRAGVLLDVRDTESIWCQGTVVEVEMGVDGPIAVLVHFNRWNSIYNEIIELPSHRLAPLHHFSGRTDIPRYNLALDDNNLRGLVVTGALPIPNHNPIEVDSSSSEEELQPNLAPMPMNGALPLWGNGFMDNWNWIRAWEGRNRIIFQDNHINEAEESHSLEDVPQLDEGEEEGEQEHEE